MTTDLQHVEAAYDHVLAPLNGSSFADEALNTATALAKLFRARLHLVSVVGSNDDRPSTQAVTANDAELVSVMVGDDVVAEIHKRAEELAPCLVCLSTHGRGRIGAAVGSVASELLRRSCRPIVVVGPSARRPSFAYRWPAPLSVSRLVACVDGSAASETVLPVAAEWATALDMALTILTVAQPVLPPLRSDGTLRRRYGPDGDADVYAARLAQRWNDRAPSVTAAVVYDPISPAQGVKAHLDGRPAGLVAVTTHARSGMRRLWSGSAAANIVRAASVPVLMVPMTG